jgi:hypothetical protein
MRLMPTLLPLALWALHLSMLHAVLWFGCDAALGAATLRATTLVAGALAALSLLLVAWRRRRARLACALALASVAWASFAPWALPPCEIVH